VTLTVLMLATIWTDQRAFAQAEKLPDVDEIMERSIEAQGGRPAFEKLHSRVTTGTYEVVNQGIKGSMTAYELAPNKQYAVMDLPGVGKVESGTDGEVYWELTAITGPRLLEGDEKAISARQSTFNALLFWRKLYQKAECVGVEEVDGRPCYKLVFTPKEGGPEIIYIDQKTYLPVRQELTLKGPMGNIPIVASLADYKKVDGVLLPHKTTQVIAGVQTVVSLAEKIEHNVEIPADRFALPEQIKALVAKSKAQTQPATRPHTEGRP